MCNQAAALRAAPLHMATLFPDNILKKAGKVIVSFEWKGHSSSSSHKKGRHHPYERPEKSQDSSKSDRLA